MSLIDVQTIHQTYNKRTVQIGQFVFLGLVATPIALSPFLEIAPFVRGASLIRDTMIQGATLGDFSLLAWALLSSTRSRTSHSGSPCTTGLNDGRCGLVCSGNTDVTCCMHLLSSTKRLLTSANPST